MNINAKNFLEIEILIKNIPDFHSHFMKKHAYFLSMRDARHKQHYQKVEFIGNLADFKFHLREK